MGMGANKRKPVLIFGLLLAALLVAGCRAAGGGSRPGFDVVAGDNAAPITGEASATQVVEQASATQAVEQPSATQPVEQAVAPEGQASQGLAAGAEPPANPIAGVEVVSVSDGGEYYVAVSYAREYLQPDGLPAPPEGHKWVVVVATLSNQGGGPLEIGPDDLTLIGQDEVRYAAEPPDEVTRPALVGASLSPDDKILGEVRFAVPAGATPLLLEWCPLEPCSQPLTSSIPRM